MAAERREQRDLVLAPNEFAHIQDTTKGEIATYVGPHTVTLSGNDVPMRFDSVSKRFVKVTMDQVRLSFVTSPAGWYVVLLNPAGIHPMQGTKNSMPNDVKIGKKVVIPGPCSFAVWPGQMATVIKGHRLRSNEYLIVEIYDEDAARENWAEATVKEVVPHGGDDQPVEEIGVFSRVPADLANGKRYVIKGTEVAFYIPPSGVKVVKDPDTARFVREAVTLEKLEYAILLDENGEKEYAYGPNLVFPRPSQRFVYRNGKRKFRAFELDQRKGIYVKVIEAYAGDDGVEHEVGTELFITGEGVIYFPRKEHAIIRYGEQEVHYAIAIPKGEGRYVLDRETGEVKMVRGPLMYLPDPRREVVTRRILSDKECTLMFPGNSEALTINRMLAQHFRGGRQGVPASAPARGRAYAKGKQQAMQLQEQSPEMQLQEIIQEADKTFAGDDFDRRTEFTEPRTIVLDTKYQGAVTIAVWTGYAAKLVNRSGESRVITGPATIMLDYDESMEPMFLSTGKPKDDANPLRTAYLRVYGNKVSDIVTAVTADLVTVTVTVSYRVNFEGEKPDKWFHIENYVKFLCDHTRSVIKAVIKKYPISQLNASITEIIRDAILGRKPEGDGRRTGMRFEENEMRVYDVEVLDFIIGDDEIEELLNANQKQMIQRELHARQEESAFATLRTIEALKRQRIAEQRLTRETEHKTRLAALEEESAALKAKQDQELQLKLELLEATRTRLSTEKQIAAEELSIKTAALEAGLVHRRGLAELAKAAEELRVSSAREIAAAFSPQIVEAINTLRDASVLDMISERFTDLAIMKDQPLISAAHHALEKLLPEGLLPVLEKLTGKSVDEVK